MEAWNGRDSVNVAAPLCTRQRFPEVERLPGAAIKYFFRDACFRTFRTLNLPNTNTHCYGTTYQGTQPSWMPASFPMAYYETSNGRSGSLTMKSHSLFRLLFPHCFTSKSQTDADVQHFIRCDCPSGGGTVFRRGYFCHRWYGGYLFQQIGTRQYLYLYRRRRLLPDHDRAG